MAGAEHRHQRAAGAMSAGLDLPDEGVQLADRPLEVLLPDLVVGRGHLPRIGRLASLSLRVHQELRGIRPVARRTRRPLEARRAASGSPLVWRTFRAGT